MPFGASPALAVFAALTALTLSACSSSTPQAENPDQVSGDGEGEGSSTTTEPQSDADQGTSVPMTSGTAKSGPRDDSNTIPDDYTVMAGDCRALGEKRTMLVRSEAMAQIDPRVSEARRSAAAENIEDVAQKAGSQYTSMCEGSLVGKIGDRQSFKCALESRTLKAFDECISPPIEKKK